MAIRSFDILFSPLSKNLDFFPAALRQSAGEKVHTHYKNLIGGFQAPYERSMHIRVPEMIHLSEIRIKECWVYISDIGGQC